MKIILFSTSDDFINNISECLLEKGHELPAVVCGPSQNKRDLFLKKRDIEIISAPDVFSSRVCKKISKYKPDLFVVVSFGRILTKEFLSVPKIGAVNIHFSLLPCYRGPAPIEWAVFNREKTTGITVSFMTEKIDTGGIILQRKFKVGETETAGHLYSRFTGAAPGILCEALVLLRDKNFSPKEQEGHVTFAPAIKKEEGKVDFKTDSASLIFRKVIAFSRRINVFTFFRRKRLIITEAAEAPDDKRCPSGAVCRLLKGKGFVVKCGEGSLLVTKVKPEGKREMSGWEFAIGRKILVGSTV